MTSSHGERSTYVNLGCRCRLCTQAASDYSREYYKRIRTEAKHWRELTKAVKQAEHEPV